MAFNVSDAMKLTSSGYASRSLVLGIFGIGVNLVTVDIIARSKGISRPMKISLFSLVVSTMAVMSSLVAYSAVTVSWNSERPGCLSVMYLLTVSMTVLYCTIVQQAVYNYAAVFYPVKFRSSSKGKIMIISSILCWIYAILVNIASLRFSLSRSFPCLFIIAIHGPRITGLFVTVVLSLVLVIVLNTRIILKIRSRDRMFRFPTDSSSTPIKTSALDDCQREVTSSHVSTGKDSVKHCRTVSCLIQMTTETSGQESKMSDTQTMNDMYSESTMEDTSGYKEVQTVSHEPTDALSVLKVCAVKSGKIRDAESTKGKVCFGEDKSSVSQHKEGEDVLTQQETHTTRNRNQVIKVSIATEKRLSGATPRLQNISKTLTFFTFWCCFLSVPFACYCLWLALTPVEQAVNFVMTTAGTLAPALIIINCSLCPFLYACRFMSWMRLLQKLKRFLCQLSS